VIGRRSLWFKNVCMWEACPQKI